MKDISEGVLRSRQRACLHQAKQACKWKNARALHESDFDLQVESTEEVLELSDAGSEDVSGQIETPSLTPAPGDQPPVRARSGGSNPNLPFSISGGFPCFDPDGIHHPRSAEWFPPNHVG